MNNYPDYKGTEIFEKIRPDVEHIAINEIEVEEGKITDKVIEEITQRICEERREDSGDFWVSLFKIRNMSSEDDWSDVNGCIKNMIEKYLKEKGV